MALIATIIGTLLILYSRVISEHDTTLKAMGSIAVKTVASLVGRVLVFFGLLVMFFHATGYM